MELQPLQLLQAAELAALELNSYAYLLHIVK